MWILLSWTFTAEQLLAGAVIAVVVALGLAPLGPVPGPWWLLHPRRLAGALRLTLVMVGKVVSANVQLARRVWHPRLPLASGMVIVRTDQRSAGRLAALGVLSSLVVDNQIVDVDRANHELQYHTVAVPPGGQQSLRAAINGPVEKLLGRISGRKGQA